MGEAEQAKVSMTDPARELVELCEGMRHGRNQTGKDYLAGLFGVEAWSLEFYQIIFTIIQRVNLLINVVDELNIDDDFKSDIRGNLTEISDAFSPESMVNPWKAMGLLRLSRANVDSLKGLFGLIRQRIAYRRVSDEELDAIDADVSQLLEWLEQHQLHENDFIREAMIEGLRAFRFRMNRLRWVGWGYALESLREVISAYMLLERGQPTKADNPDAAAILAKVRQGLKSLHQKIGIAKDATETADWLLRIYGAAAAMQAATPTVAGLLK